MDLSEPQTGEPLRLMSEELRKTGPTLSAQFRGADPICQSIDSPRDLLRNFPDVWGFADCLWSTPGDRLEGSDCTRRLFGSDWRFGRSTRPVAQRQLMPWGLSSRVVA